VSKFVRVYIAHPFAGDGSKSKVENVQAYIELARAATAHGGIAVVTWVHHALIAKVEEDERTPEFWLARDFALIDAADVVVAFWPGRSNGVRREVQYAKNRGIRVLVVDDEETAAWATTAEFWDLLMEAS